MKAYQNVKEDSKRSAVSQNHGTGANSADRDEHMADFSAEWCCKLLDDPSYEQSGVFSRRPAPSTDASFNTLMRKTLFTDHTIRAMR